MFESVHLGVRREHVAKVVGEGLHILLPDGVPRSWPCPVSTGQVVFVHDFRVVKIVTTAREYHSRTFRRALLTPTVCATGCGMLAVIPKGVVDAHRLWHAVGDHRTLQPSRLGVWPARPRCSTICSPIKYEIKVGSICKM